MPIPLLTFHAHSHSKQLDLCRNGHTAVGAHHKLIAAQLARLVPALENHLPAPLHAHAAQLLLSHRDGLPQLHLGNGLGHDEVPHLASRHVQPALQLHQLLQG